MQGNIMQWIIICPSYRRANWLMNTIANKYAGCVLIASLARAIMLFDDGIGLNQFIFINNDSDKLLSLRPDITLYERDFRQMWLLE